MSTNKQKLLFSLLFLLSTISLKADPSLFPEEQKHLIIQNRILAKVGDTTISVLDVVKKMEVFLNKYYPQYANSLPAKYQYFSTQWKDILLQMIDHELMLLDADKMELKITDSEVRETLFEKFGPNVMQTLDKIGLTYEEAKAMIHSELVVQKMTWFKVHAKALSAINTQDVKLAYANYCEKNPPKEEWEYQTLSIRAQNEEIAHQIAQRAFELCKTSPSNIEKVIEELQQPVGQNSEEAPSFHITLSDTIKTETKNLSLAYKSILSRLPIQAISEPIKQANKTDQNSLYRIFYLKNHNKTTLPSLRSLYDNLQNQLIQEESEKGFRVYLTKLRD
ncbi:MAG: SurA N-terminal domain-containing protein, partial [Verrucomicrobia bacterium]|nr:SurA N-terminal domain-containing protein [Verrucomicrobiota bacterium]